MHDDQVAGSYHPDRTEEDPEDLEYHGLLSESDSGSKDGSSDDTADAGAADNTADVRAANAGAANQGGLSRSVTPLTDFTTKSSTYTCKFLPS